MITLASLAALTGILKTVLGIGGLILVHELGHFLVGRWCGVRAEAFSIGFPPTVFKWQPGETEYRFGLLPLGGYVKFAGEYEDMYGSDPEPGTFPAATYPRKVAIMLAGVAMNVLAAFVLFALTFKIGVNVTPAEIGAMRPDGAAWAAGLEVGDEIIEIDGVEIREFRDVAQEVVLKPEADLVVVRDGERQPPVRVQLRAQGGGVHRLEIEAPGSITLLMGVESDSIAHEAGFRGGDEVVRVDGAEMENTLAALRAHAAADGPTKWTVRRDGKEQVLTLPRETKTVYRIGVGQSSRRLLAVRRGSAADQIGLRTGDVVRRVGTAPVNTVHAFVTALRADGASGPIVVERNGTEQVLPVAGEGSPAEIADGIGARGEGMVFFVPQDVSTPSAARAAGVPDGAIAVSINGKRVEEWHDLTELVARSGEIGAPLRFELQDPGGGSLTKTISPLAVEEAAGVGLTAIVSPKQELMRSDGIGESMVLGLKLTDRWVRRILATLGSLVTGKVSPTNLAGPILLSKLTYQQGQKSWGDLFLFLGMISLNLAVLNLLPIPALDGGQLALITAAKIRGRALPEKLEWGIQMAGWVMVLGLMVFVIVNDLRRL